MVMSLISGREGSKALHRPRNSGIAVEDIIAAAITLQCSVEVVEASDTLNQSVNIWVKRQQRELDT